MKRTKFLAVIAVLALAFAVFVVLNDVGTDADSINLDTIGEDKEGNGYTFTNDSKTLAISDISIVTDTFTGTGITITGEVTEDQIAVLGFNVKKTYDEDVTYYTTLDQAINALDSALTADVEFKVLADHNGIESAKLSTVDPVSYTAVSEYEVTIDLNKKVYTTAGHTGGGGLDTKTMYFALGAGTLTIKDGTIKADPTNEYGSALVKSFIPVFNLDNVVLDASEISATATTDHKQFNPAAYDGVKAGTALYVSNGVANLTNGTEIIGSSTVSAVTVYGHGQTGTGVWDLYKGAEVVLDDAMIEGNIIVVSQNVTGYGSANYPATLTVENADVNGDIVVVNNTAVINDNGATIASTGIKKVDIDGMLTIDGKVSIPTDVVVTIAADAVLDGKVTGPDNNFIEGKIKGGTGGLTLTGGSLIVNGDIVEPDENGIINISGVAVTIEGSLDDGVTLIIAPTSTVTLSNDLAVGSNVTISIGAGSTLDTKTNGKDIKAIDGSVDKSTIVITGDGTLNAEASEVADIGTISTKTSGGATTKYVEGAEIIKFDVKYTVKKASLGGEDIFYGVTVSDVDFDGNAVTTSDLDCNMIGLTGVGGDITAISYTFEGRSLLRNDMVNAGTYNDAVSLSNTISATISGFSYSKAFGANASLTILPIDFTLAYNKNCTVSATVPPAKVMQVGSTDDVVGEISNEATREGYTFARWNTTPDGTGADVTSTTLVYSIGASYTAATIYAIWTPNTYEVEFDANKPAAASGEVDPESLMDNQEFTYDVADNLNACTLELIGWHFVKWNTQADGLGTNYADEEEVLNLVTEGTFTLYAVWAQNEYTVVFDSNKPENASGDIGGDTADQVLHYDDALTTLTANGYTLTGWHFVGWNTVADGSGDVYDNEAEVQNLATDGEFTLYAQWVQNTYTVRFDKNSGEATGDMEDQVFTYDDDAVALTLNGYALTGKDFSRWDTVTEGTGDPYEDGEEVLNLSAVDGDTVTLYAQWVDHQPLIVVDLGGGELDEAVYKAIIDAGWAYDVENDQFTKNCGLATTIASIEAAFGADPGITKTGYNTPTWAVTKEGEPYEEATVDDDVVLTVEWTANTYTVIFDSNKPALATADVTGEMGNQDFVYDEAQDLTDNAYALTGWTFLGWATLPTGDVVYEDGEEAINLTVVNEGEVTLYAVWYPNTYTVIFDANEPEGEATGTMLNQIFIYDVADNLRLNAYALTGWTFLGWATAPNGDVVYTDGQEVVNLSAEDGAEVTIYAVWQLNTFKITFNANCMGDQYGYMGDMPDEGYYDYGTTVTLTKDAYIRIGYYFNGWNTAADGSGIPYADEGKLTGLPAAPETTITLYAQWLKVTYMVSVEDENGEEVESLGPFAIDQAVTLTAVDDVNFIGWTVKGTDKFIALGNQYIINDGDAVLILGGHIITLKQTFSDEPVGVTYDIEFDGAEIAAIEDVVEGQVITLPEAPELVGSIFVGYEINGNILGAQYTVSALDADEGVITITAVYAEIPEPIVDTEIVIDAAPVHDTSGKIPDADIIKGYYVSTSVEQDYVLVTVHGKDLKQHYNALGMAGYWAGARFTTDVAGVYYVSLTSFADALLEDGTAMEKVGDSYFVAKYGNGDLSIMYMVIEIDDVHYFYKVVYDVTLYQEPAAGLISVTGEIVAGEGTTVDDITLSYNPKVAKYTSGYVFIKKNVNAVEVTITAENAAVAQISDNVWMFIPSGDEDVLITATLVKLEPTGVSDFYIPGLVGDNTGVVVKLTAADDGGLFGGKVTVKGTMYTYVGELIVYDNFETEAADIAIGDMSFLGQFDIDEGWYVYSAYAVYEYTEGAQGAMATYTVLAPAKPKEQEQQ